MPRRAQTLEPKTTAVQVDSCRCRTPGNHRAVGTSVLSIGQRPGDSSKGEESRDPASRGGHFLITLCAWTASGLQDGMGRGGIQGLPAPSVSPRPGADPSSSGAAVCPPRSPPTPAAGQSLLQTRRSLTEGFAGTRSQPSFSVCTVLLLIPLAPRTSPVEPCDNLQFRLCFPGNMVWNIRGHRSVQSIF